MKLPEAVCHMVHGDCVQDTAGARQCMACEIGLEPKAAVIDDAARPAPPSLPSLPPSLPGGGGGLRSAIYHNLPQFYRNFSVFPPFKDFIFPLRNFFHSHCYH